MIDVAYSLKVITGPTTWVATPEDVTRYGGREGDTTEDKDILEVIKASTAMMETLCDRIFCTQTLEMRLDAYPTDGWLQLPKGPWQSIVSVKDYESGVLTTMSSADYVFEETSGILQLVDGASWPVPDIRPGAVQIRFKAGYGDLYTDVPLIARRAVILGVIDELANRNGRFEIPPGVRQQLMALWPGTV